MNIIDDFASRIETKLKVTDAPGMDIRFTMNRDAAAAYIEQLRATSKLVEEYGSLRATLDQIKVCCIDNAADTVRHDLALKFVGDLAAKALASTHT